MDDVKQLIDKAYRQLLLISVSGDSVEMMVNAKAMLRTAFAKLEKEEDDG